jgi:hypothetical protein
MHRDSLCAVLPAIYSRVCPSTEPGIKIMATHFGVPVCYLLAFITKTQS